MATPGLSFVRHVWRESRRSRARLAFFVACLSIGVAAVVAVAGLSSGLEEAIRVNARELLAADLTVSARRELPEELDRLIDGVPGARRTHILELATMVSAPAGDAAGTTGRSQLCELEVLDGEYPFYGRLELDPPRPLAELLAPDATVVAVELSSRLQLALGDPLRIGETTYRVAGIVRAEPGRLDFSLSLGPRVFLSLEGFERAQLARQGSNIRHRTLIRMPDGSRADETNDFARRLRFELSDAEYVRIETYAQAQPALRRGLERVTSYLGLVALASLLVGGIGIAQTVRAWIAARLDSIAVQKCLGVRPREILLAYAAQAVLLGLVGSAVGALLGVGVELAVLRWFSDFVPEGVLDPLQPGALLRGVALGVGVALLFSLRPLLSTLAVPPARVLRRDAEPLPERRSVRIALVTALLAGITLAARAQADSWVFGLGFTAGAAVLAGVLALAARGLMVLALRAPRERLPLALRHGVAALARPGADTPGAIVALGLGVLVVLGTHLVQARLAAELGNAVPEGAPTAYLIDVQTSQWDGVRELLAQQGAEHIESVPVVSARLSHIDGRSVDDLSRERRGQGRGRRMLTREQRLTYLQELPPDNRIVEGALWSDPARAEISLEFEFADDLDVQLGSLLTFDVQGVPIDVTVTSVRTVEWRRLGLNFFMVVEPGVLESAPQFRVASARLVEANEDRTQDLLAERFPNVTLLRVRAIFAKLGEIFEKIRAGVALLGGFTVLAGIAILFGAVSASSAHRARDVTLLQTLGATRATVVGMLAVEYALVGATAGAIGAAGANVLAWAVLTYGLELEPRLGVIATLVTVAATALVAAVAGLIARAPSLSRSPLDALRAE